MSSKQIVIRISDMFSEDLASFGPIDEELGRKVFGLLREALRPGLSEIHLDEYAPPEPESAVIFED